MNIYQKVSQQFFFLLCWLDSVKKSVWYLFSVQNYALFNPSCHLQKFTKFTQRTALLAYCSISAVLVLYWFSFLAYMQRRQNSSQKQLKKVKKKVPWSPDKLMSKITKNYDIGRMGGIWDGETRQRAIYKPVIWEWLHRRLAARCSLRTTQRCTL